MFQVVSNISSVITLFLFIIYIIGRIWAINKSKKICYEEIKLEYIKECNIEGKKIYDLGGNSLIKIISEQGISWIKIYKLSYDEKNNKLIWDNKKTVLDNTFNPVDKEIYLKINVPCGIPTYRIEYERFDYIKDSFNISLNNEYGGIYKSDFKRKVSLKGYMYFFCK